MDYLSQERLVVLGSAGAIGSNAVQSALTMRLTPNVVMYDPFDKGNEGAAEEIRHCAFPGARVTATSDIAEALRGASYLISSGGAPRKEGMTREDLLKGNAEIAAQLGLDIRRYCPSARFAVIIFNPADITAAVWALRGVIHSERTDADYRGGEVRNDDQSLVLDRGNTAHDIPRPLHGTLRIPFV